MPNLDPYKTELQGATFTPVSKTGADTTKTALGTIAIPAYKLRLGSIIRWEAIGQVTLNTANRNFTSSVELGSFQTYNTTHSRSGTNVGEIFYNYDLHTHNGAAAALGVAFTTTAPAGGNDLLSRQFLPVGTTATATDWWGTGMCVVTAAPGASVTCRGGGHVHFTGVDQGGTPTASSGFDTDGNQSGTVNTTVSNNFGIYVQWAAGSNALDVFTVNSFVVQILGYDDGL